MASNISINYFIWIFVPSIFFFTSYAQTENTYRPEVTYPQGTIQGTTITSRYNRSISAFLGIPYGQPPIGNLRFANPLVAGNWTGIRDGSVNGNNCAQSGSDGFLGNEDCLYLNVYRPQEYDNVTSLSLPVMFYVHGGAFLSGSGASTKLSPVYILDKEVILVVINYRMGPFGFLSTGDEVASGNYGLKDMVLALRWVQDYIAYFGGDPDRVTIFGGSAGSTSVHLLTLSDTTEGLFQRFITQSGSALATWAVRPRVAYANFAYRLGGYVGCQNDTSEILVNCLRARNASDIVATYGNFYEWRTYPIDPWGPTIELDIEGAFITDTPTDLYAAGKIRNIPWIVGTTRDEGATDTAVIYEDEEVYDEFMADFDHIVVSMLTYNYLPDGGASWLKSIKSYYFNDDFSSMDKETILANVTTFITDSHFLYPAWNSINQHFALTETPQFFYNFSYRGSYSVTEGSSGSTTDYGVAHADEANYLFPCQLLFQGCVNTETSETDHQMIDVMTELWTSFAANGVPTSLNGTPWDAYSSAENYLQIGDGYGVELSVHNFSLHQRMEFWAGLYASLENLTNETENSGALTWTPSSFFVLLFTYILLV